MKEMLFSKFKSILKNEFLAKIFAYIFYLPFVIVYNLKSVFQKKEIANYDDAIAEEKLKEVYENNVIIPEARYQQQDSNIDISVIIPCYNNAKYLNECVDSVLNQEGNFKTEVICVNDGSTDNTLDVLSEYEDKILLINTKNGGAAQARNIGLDNAKGKYIFFIDSDDYLLPGCLDTLLQVMKENKYDRASVSYYDFCDEYKKLRLENGFSWGVLYKRETFINVRMPINNIFEDTINPFIVNAICPKNYLIKRPYYMRRIVPTSITASVKGNPKGLSHFYVVKYLAEYSKVHNYLNDIELYKAVLHHYGSILNSRIKNLDEEIVKYTFSLACNDFKKYIVKDKVKLSYRNKQIQKSLLQHNYSKWCLASKWL